MTVNIGHCNSWRCIEFLSLACLVGVGGVKLTMRAWRRRTWKERSTANRKQPEAELARDTNTRGIIATTSDTYTIAIESNADTITLTV